READPPSPEKTPVPFGGGKGGLRRHRHFRAFSGTGPSGSGGGGCLAVCRPHLRKPVQGGTASQRPGIFKRDLPTGGNRAGGRHRRQPPVSGPDRGNPILRGGGRLHHVGDDEAVEKRRGRKSERISFTCGSPKEAAV